MSYSRINRAEEQQEACQKAKHITAVCKQFHITLDPIDWQQCGMWAPVKVNEIPIAYLLDFGQPDADDILRRVQIKLLERAALQSIHARPGIKASMWSPVDVVQPQPFLCLWVITLETNERIPIIEVIRDGQRVYEHYQFDRNNTDQKASLFGPASQGEYHLGERITLKEHDHQYTGEILYIIPLGKTLTNRKPTSRGFNTLARTANEVTARYLVDCNDGFPHIVHQSQVTR
jgi:GAF domain-containing protein